MASQDINALVDLLAPDATATGDVGGLVTATPRPVEGAEQIARFFANRPATAPNRTILERTVNGQPGLVVHDDGDTVSVMAFDIAGHQITRIWAILNPDKLRQLITSVGARIILAEHSRVCRCLAGLVERV